MAVPQLTFQSSTTYEDALRRAAAESKIQHEYWDIFGHRHEASSNVLKSILSALGWDVSSHDAIERKRAQNFLAANSAVLPKTLVISNTEQFIPLTIPTNTLVAIRCEFDLEDGARRSIAIDTSQLSVRHETVWDNNRWVTFALPLPGTLPQGYHSVQVSINGKAVATSNLIVCPDKAYLPERFASGGKTAGFNIALYGVRSGRNWGCGDFTDLRGVIDWAIKSVGFSFIGLNPLHALHNRLPYNASPYLPLSSFYKNLLYLDIEGIAEFATSNCARSVFRTKRIQDQIARLRAADYVAYEEVSRLKTRFLKMLYREFRKPQNHGSERWQKFQSYCLGEGDPLDRFALYCALDELLHKHNRNWWTWRDWPTEFQKPDSEACQRFAAEHARTIEFYKYIQFVIDEQLTATQKYAKDAGMEIGLYHDMAVATDSHGSDLWAYGNFYVEGCRVGAPPDDFSPKGQDWGFPPPNILANRADGYRLYRESLRKVLRCGGALRIDHVMRLFRLFWIPAGVEAAQGTYVSDFEVDLMRILALESVREKNIIIGEDLGTVTDYIREMLAKFRILSYRLFYFEKHGDGSFKRTGEYPVQALVASTTHDLPTLAGFWQNRDIEARKAAGLADEGGYWQQIRDRQRDKQKMLDALHAEGLLPASYERNAANLPELNGDLHNAVIGFLANVPSMILLINQEDLTKELEQQNLPGSTAQYPNWQRKMRWTVEELASPAMWGFAEMFRHQLARTGRK